MNEREERPEVRGLSASSLGKSREFRPSLRGFVKRLLRRAANQCGFDVMRLTQPTAPSAVAPFGPPDSRNEGFARYWRAAEAAGMDVNDWIEAQLGWDAALPLLEEVVFPRVGPNSRICEIGPGTGRHARHLVKRIPQGELHLLDHSAWTTAFLRKYFEGVPSVRVIPSCGTRIELPAASQDVCFSNGTFIELKLGAIFLYAEEMARVLRPGGFAIFDYIDIAESEGWEHLHSQSRACSSCFTYHRRETVDEIFRHEGFSPRQRVQRGKSTYVVYERCAH